MISMEVTTIESFLEYFERIRERTLNVIRCIPPDMIEWTYREDRFTFGDLIRHLATIERFMYAETVMMRPSRYPGHGRELADGYDEVLRFFNRLHEQSMHIFRSLSDEDLYRKCITPGGAQLSVWKWLRAMIEHEAHHRGQLYIYLSMIDIPTPPLYGLTSEQVLERSEP